MRMMKTWLFASGAALLAGGPAVASDATLTLHLENARSDEGQLIVCLWTEETAEAFPRCGDDAGPVGRVAVPLEGGKATVSFPAEIGKTYAVTAMHDENGDGEMNRRLMIPSEGVGLSSDAVFGFPPPGFSDAAFVLDGDADLTIPIQYW